MSPKMLGRFEIVSELGQSDLMSVYLAKNPREERMVVLRTMQLESAEPAAAARLIAFRESAARVCRLDSPNIGAFYEYGEADGCFFLVAEYVVGETLRKQIDDNKDFSLDDILDLTRQACSAFDHAHSRDIATDNLQPAKFIIESDGTLKIVDFGLSETVGQNRKSALHYRSPEEFDHEKPDLRSNLFSWGAVLYEVVTGQEAFPGFDEQSIRESVLELMPPSPEVLLPGMPPGVSAAIMKALRKDFNGRYVRGSEMVRALEDYKNYKPQETELPFMLQQHVRVGRTQADTKPSPRIAAANITTPKAPVLNPLSTAVDPVAATAAMASAAAPAPERLKAPVSHVAEVAPRASVAEAILSEYAPPKAPVQQQAKTAAQALAQVHSWASGPANRDLGIDPAGPAMPPQVGTMPKVLMSSRTRLLVYASMAVLVALTAVLSTGSHFRKASASQPQLPAASTVSNDPAFSEPFAPKPAAAATQPTPPKEAVAFEIDDAPPKIDEAPPKIKRLKPHLQAPAKVVPAPPPAMGELSVATVPGGARVQVDGRGDVEWVTPCVVAGLTPGHHVVTMSKPGFVVASRAVEVTAGERAEISLPMAQLGATLKVSSNPPGGSILIDGKETGTVTPAQVVVPHGKHSVSVQKAGYLDSSTMAEFTPGQVFKFDPTLQAMGNVDRMRPAGKMGKLFGKGTPDGMARLQIRSTPKNAQITVNNRVLDHDTPTDVLLEPGSYQVTLSLPGYKSVQKVITVESGGKFTVDETLER